MTTTNAQFDILPEFSSLNHYLQMPQTLVICDGLIANFVGLCWIVGPIHFCDVRLQKP